MPEADRVKLPKRGRLLTRAFDRAVKRRGSPGEGVSSDEFMFELVAEASVMATKEFRRAVRALEEVRDVLTALAGPVPRAMLQRERVEFDPREFELRLARRQEPARVNGHCSYGDGVASSQPEGWHPESGLNPESYN